MGGCEYAENLVAEPLADEFYSREVDRSVAKTLESNGHPPGFGTREELRAEAGKPHRRARAVERERVGVGPPLKHVCKHEHFPWNKGQYDPRS